MLSGCARRAKPPGDHCVDGEESTQGIEIGGVTAHDLDALGECQPGDEAPAQIAAILPPIDQNDTKIRPVNSDHETGHSASAAEIEHGAGHVGEGGDEAAGVSDRRVDRTAP